MGPQRKGAHPWLVLLRIPADAGTLAWRPRTEPPLLQLSRRDNLCPPPPHPYLTPNCLASAAPLTTRSPSQIPGGYIARRFGGKWVLGGGILGTVAFTFLTPVAARQSVSVMVALRVRCAPWPAG
jgi:hypothetical protein